MKILLTIGVFVVAFVLLIVFFYDPLTPDESAVLLIDRGRAAEHYETLQASCERAHKIAKDPDVIKVADHLARGAGVMIASRNRKQSDNTEGMTVQEFVNAIMAGINPRDGWEGIRIFVEAQFLKDEYERIEQKYGEFGFLDQQTRLSLFTIFIISFGISACMFFVSYISRRPSN